MGTFSTRGQVYPEDIRQDPHRAFLNAFRTPRPAWQLWLPAFAVTMTVLCLGFLPALRPQTVPQLLDLRHVSYNFVDGEWYPLVFHSRRSAVTDLIGFVLFGIWRWPALAKAAGLAAIAGAFMTWLVRYVAGLLDMPPFLKVGPDGIAGDTPWGRQEVSWPDVTAISHRTRLTPFGPREQLVITTRLVTRLDSPLDRLLWASEMMPVGFETPPREHAQIAAIKAHIRLMVPAIAITEEEIDSRPAFLRD